MLKASLNDTHIPPQEDSPCTFPLYTEVMGKGKAKAEEGAQPEVPKKQLTEEDLKELNLPMYGEVPTVPQQNPTTEDIQHNIDLSIEVGISGKRNCWNFYQY